MIHIEKFFNGRIQSAGSPPPHGTHKDKPIRCQHCPAIVTFRDFRDHLVNEHGYQREGNQVFQRKECRVCGKPALYKVGRTAYCKAHKGLATQQRYQVRKALEPKSAEIERHQKEMDDEALKAERERSMKKWRTPAPPH